MYVDLETTGVDPERHQVIEIGAVVFSGGKEIAEFSGLVYPGEDALRAADRRALDVNKIDLTQVRSARSTVVMAEAFQAFRAIHRGTLYAFPVQFESSFLEKAPWHVSGWGDCVMKAVREMMIADNALANGIDGKPKRPSLSEAAAFFGVTGCGQAHRSLSDARKTGRIHQQLMERQAVKMDGKSS